MYRFLSKSEQGEIADFLDCETARIDELIAKKERLIQLLDSRHQGIIDRFVSGTTPEEPGQPTGIEWCSTIPTHWTLVKLRYTCTIQSGIDTWKETGAQRCRGRAFLTYVWLNVQDGFLDLRGHN